MVLGRNGLRDERRRRALIDETLHGGADASTASVPDDEAGRRVHAKPYSEAARVTHHAPVSVCIPKRPLAVWGWFVLGVALIAAIEGLHAQVYTKAPAAMQASLTALDVTARGSLSAWFASVMLCCSALASYLVYLIRRHRTDDYRGRYRWWLWLVPLLLVLSVNAGTGLHAVLSGVLTSLSGAEVAVGGKGWWLIAYAAVFLPIVLQLAIEIWPSRLATTFFALTVAGYLAAAAFELQAIQCATPLATTIAHSSALLAAHFGVLLSILSYGRYVYLEAHDELAARKRWKLGLKLRLPRRSAPKKPKRKAETKSRGAVTDKEAAGSDDAAKRVRVDASHSKFGQAADKPPQVTLSATATEDDEDDADESSRRPSKQERKRLRREGVNK